MSVSRRRVAALSLAGLFGLVSVLVLQAGPAGATVSGPCSADLDGVSVTTGHDTAGTAVHADYRENAKYMGQATDGRSVGGIQVAIEIVGLKIRSHGGSTNGSQWSSTVSVKKYAWAGIGLYRVSGTAVDERGAPICTGRVFICVDGKSPLLTVAGAAAVAMGLFALFLLVRGLMQLRRRSRLRVAWRLGGAGILGGVAVPLLLQQSCVAELTPALLGATAGGGVVALVLFALLAGGRRSRRRPEEPIAATTPTPPASQDPDRSTVYRFVPSQEACAACQSHAAHRTYRAAAAAETDRAHAGCHCEVVPQVAHDPFLVARFKGRDVLDDREA